MYSHRYTFDTRFFCNYCHSVFASAKILKQHRQTCYSIGYLCKEPGCGAYFKEASPYYRHLGEKHNQKHSFVCGQCDQVHYVPAAIKTHLSRCHDPSKSRYLCETCRKTFHTELQLITHKKNYHHICPSCHEIRPEVVYYKVCSGCQAKRAEELKKNYQAVPIAQQPSSPTGFRRIGPKSPAPFSVADPMPPGTLPSVASERFAQPSNASPSSRRTDPGYGISFSTPKEPIECGYVKCWNCCEEFYTFLIEYPYCSYCGSVNECSEYAPDI